LRAIKITAPSAKLSWEH